MTSRGALGLASSRTRRRLALTWAVLFILSILLQYAAFVMAPAALAVHDEGLFELDGNAVSGAAPGEDWDHVFAHSSAADATEFIDDGVGTGDDIFTGGSSKDDHNIGSWLWKTGGVQDKNDITHAFAASYTATSQESAGDTIVYFGLDKFDASGDNFVGFWFLQGAVGPTGSGNAPGSPFSGTHHVGDILVLADYTNGGDIATFSVYKWVTSGGDAATHLLKVASGVPCTGGKANDDACGDTNTATVDAPWPFKDKSGKTDFLPGELFEGGINLTNLGLDKTCFTSFIAETRSSQAVDATLSDFAGGTFSFCKPPTIATQVEQDGQSLGSLGSINVGESVQDTATLTGSKGTVTGTVDFFVCHGASAAPSCASGGDQVGGTKTLSGGKATSASFKPDAAGFYCFRVEYTPPATGSKYLAADHTNKTTECFRVLPAQVTIKKTADGTSVSAGGDVGFTLSWGNTGAGNATGVVVTDNLPGDSGLDWSIDDSSGSGSTCSIAGAVGHQVLTCAVGTIDAKTAVDGTVHVTSGTTAASCGTVDNTGHIASTNDGSGNDSASMAVNCPDVTIEKVARDPTVFIGGTATFDIKVANIGTGTAHGVVLTDPLPGGLDWHTSTAGCAIAAGTLTCTIGDLAPKASFVATVSANTDTQAPDTEDCHVLDNTGTVSATNEPAGATGNNESSASITVTCVSSLTIQKSVAGNTGGTDPDLHVPAAKIGDTLTYTLAYTGAGPLHDVVITDDLPNGLAFVQGSACKVASDPLPCDTANPDFVFIGVVGGLLTWQADALPDPATGSVKFKVKVLAAAAEVAQPIVNTATIDSDETEPDSDTAAVAVLPPPEALTPPPTSTETPLVGPGNPGFALMLILLAIGAVVGGLALVTPVPNRLKEPRR